MQVCRACKPLEIADHFLYDCISSKREKLRCTNRVEEDEFDLLTALMVEEEEILSVSGKISDKFLRDCIRFLGSWERHYQCRSVLVFLAYCNTSISRNQDFTRDQSQFSNK